jgi:hypothetical protein
MIEERVKREDFAMLFQVLHIQFSFDLTNEGQELVMIGFRTYMDTFDSYFTPLIDV